MNQKKIRVVLDTQIILRAAINRRSLPAKLLFELGDKYQLFISQDIINEIEDVLNRPKLRQKFAISDETIDAIIGILVSKEFINPQVIPAISRDPKDDKFLACALAANAHYLVSEDNDLLVLNPYENIGIINALEFLNILNEA